MQATRETFRQRTPPDVKENDIIATQGFRCVATQVSHYEENGKTVARYTLHSAPSERMPHELPHGYEGMRSGGNDLASVWILES